MTFALAPIDQKLDADKCKVLYSQLKSAETELREKIGGQGRIAELDSQQAVTLLSGFKTLSEQLCLRAKWRGQDRRQTNEQRLALIGATKQTLGDLRQMAAAIELRQHVMPALTALRAGAAIKDYPYDGITAQELSLNEGEYPSLVQRFDLGGFVASRQSVGRLKRGDVETILTIPSLAKLLTADAAMRALATVDLILKADPDPRKEFAIGHPLTQVKKLLGSADTYRDALAAFSPKGTVTEDFDRVVALATACLDRYDAERRTEMQAIVDRLTTTLENDPTLKESPNLKDVIRLTELWDSAGKFRAYINNHPIENLSDILSASSAALRARKDRLDGEAREYSEDIVAIFGQNEAEAAKRPLETQLAARVRSFVDWSKQNDDYIKHNGHRTYGDTQLDLRGVLRMAKSWTRNDAGHRRREALTAAAG